MHQDQPEEQLEEIEIEAIGIEISNQPIELYKIFKIANLVNGGGEAKHIISEGYVAVNGEIETRKRRKVYDGDLIEFDQEYYLVIFDGAAVEADSAYEHIEDNPLPQMEDKTDDVEPEQSSTENKGKGRKSIQFF